MARTMPSALCSTTRAGVTNNNNELLILCLSHDITWRPLTMACMLLYLYQLYCLMAFTICLNLCSARVPLLCDKAITNQVCVGIIIDNNAKKSSQLLLSVCSQAIAGNKTIVSDCSLSALEYKTGLRLHMETISFENWPEASSITYRAQELNLFLVCTFCHRSKASKVKHLGEIETTWPV